MTGALAQDARAFMAATAEVAGEKVSEARERLAAALETAKLVGQVRENAVERVKAADQVVRANPYQAIGLASVWGPPRLSGRAPLLPQPRLIAPCTSPH